MSAQMLAATNSKGDPAGKLKVTTIQKLLIIKERKQLVFYYSETPTYYQR